MDEFYFVILCRKWWRFWDQKYITMASDIWPPKTLPKGYNFVRKLMTCTTSWAPGAIDKRLDPEWRRDRELREEGR